MKKQIKLTTKEEIKEAVSKGIEVYEGSDNYKVIENKDSTTGEVFGYLIWSQSNDYCIGLHGNENVDYALNGDNFYYYEGDFNSLKTQLTDRDVQQIVDLICKRCGVSTYNQVRSVLRYDASRIPSYGILGRLLLEKGEWSYCAGQSYPDEIRTVRGILKTGK